MSTTISTPSLSEILALEDDPELMGHYCPGTSIPVWALIRVAFIRTIMSDLLFKTTSLMECYQQRRYKQVMKYVVCSMAHNAKHWNDYSSEICIFSSGLGNFLRDSKTFDRLTGYFASVYPENSLIYQDHGGWCWHSNFHFPRVLYTTPFALRARMLGRFRANARLVKLAATVVERAVINARERIGHQIRPDDAAILKRSLVQQLAEMPIATDYYAGWFARRNVKLLLKEDASYGARSIPVLTAARLAGVRTAEYQHGAISMGHDGYNVASALTTNPDFKQTLPEYLLTYGEWWGEQTNLPLQRVVIGNPHFTESTKRLTSCGIIRDRILILGDGIETELYLSLAKHVAKIAQGSGLRVVFRPHPLERHRAQHAAFPSEVELDKNSDVYTSFAVTSILISELSTGLFEAVGLVDRIVMWNTEKARFAFPRLPFPSFSNLDELEDVLFGTAQGSADVNGMPEAKSSMWANDWQTNYKNFVMSVLKK